MTERMASLTKKRSTRNVEKIPIVVCEYHQEVIQFIHRFIARKKLPFKGIKMVHLDSHPDLAFPDSLVADDCFDKSVLYDQLDIADWILPLAYQGHLRHVVWVHPPWARQIANVTSAFNVGKHSTNGKLKVTCTEDYFLEDGMFCSERFLENCQPVNLHVVSLECLVDEMKTSTNTDDLHAGGGGGGDSKQPLQKRPKTHCHEGGKQSVYTTENGEGCADGTESCLPACPTDPYILDVDLDFFSVTNPFLQDYTEAEYKQLKEIYQLDLPKDKENEKDLMEFVEKSTAKLDSLKRTIQDFVDGTDNQSTGQDASCGLIPSNAEDNPSTSRKATPSDSKFSQFVSCKVTTSEADNTEQHKSEERINHKLIDFLKKLKQRKQGTDIDWELVHSAGMTTELPHHISTDDEINALMKQFEHLLTVLPRPTMVTIARSAVDEYCPPDQVDGIEQRVVELLSNAYGENIVDVHYDYKDDSRLF